MAKLQTYRLTSPDICPNCHAQHDARTGKATPKPGDIALCFSCGAIHELGDDLKRKVIGAHKIDELLSENVDLRLIYTMLTEEIKRRRQTQ